ncbi:MAG: hypothetical protein PHP20_07040 [Firmicutes bacterium]|jgi:hypothetical protein|nr:hypothetical protein [Bacillota bacterium]MDD4336331.1 hypothetical protein [Bacillota bacterium]MDD4792806.1 hypothetical protein [Bacillota bacterium]
MSSYAGVSGDNPTRIIRRSGWARQCALTFLAAIGIMLASCFPALCQSAPTLESQVIGDLSLAVVTPVGDDLEIAYADILSFRVPLNAGYLIYERIDSRGVRNLCLANYNSSGIDFELMIDLFPLETESVTSLDMMARGLLSAGTRSQAIDSRSIEISGVPGFDVTARGIMYDRVMPKGETRMVFLTDFSTGVTLTLVGRQDNPEKHTIAMNGILSTLQFTDQ